MKQILTTIKKGFLVITLMLFSASLTSAQPRSRASFNEGWKFFLGDNENAKNPNFDDSKWRRLTLPHDWSIEGAFDEKNPAKPEGGGLPTGIGWYRKSFVVPASSASKIITVEDGTVIGGFGSAILEFMNAHHYKADIKILGIPDIIIEHASQKQQQSEAGIDAEHLADAIREMSKIEVTNDLQKV